MSELERDSKMSESACNKAMKAAIHKNVLEQTACDTTTKSIEAQRRSLHTRRTREERELRAQLQRLQDEQRLLSEIDNTDATSDAVGFNDDANSFDNDPFNFDPEQVVNPYPIAVRPRQANNAPPGIARCNFMEVEHAHSNINSLMKTQGANVEVGVGKTIIGNTANEKKYRVGGSMPSPRNVRSAEYEDIDVTYPAFSAAGRQSAAVSGGASRSSVSTYGDVPNTDQLAVVAGGHVWLGDPEAISSVRRARKAPGQQRMDQIWARSRSLKERPTSGRTTSHVTHRSDVSPLSGSPSTSGACSRAGSLKETHKSGAKSCADSVSEVMSQLDVKPRRAVSLKTRSSRMSSTEVVPDIKGQSVAMTSSSSSSLAASQDQPLSLSYGSGGTRTPLRSSKITAAHSLMGAVIDGQMTSSLTSSLLPPIVSGETLDSHHHHSHTSRQSPQQAFRSSTQQRAGSLCRSPSLKSQTIEHAVGMLN